MANVDGANTPDLATQAGEPTGQAERAHPVKDAETNGEDGRRRRRSGRNGSPVGVVRHQLPEHLGGGGRQGDGAEGDRLRVIVDVGYKSEGVIAVGEFVDETGQINVQPGDLVDVLLERRKTRTATSSSPRKAEKMKIWDEIEKAYADSQGRHRSRHRGGSRAAWRRHRRAGVPARIAGRRAARPEPGCSEEPGTPECASSRSTRSAATSSSRARSSRRGERREEEVHAGDAGRGQGAARSGERTSPTTAPSSTWAASTA